MECKIALKSGTKQQSIDFKSVSVAIVTLSILALMFTVQPEGVFASSNNDNDNDNGNDNDNDNSNNDGGSDSGGQSGEDLGSDLCRLIDENRLAAAALAFSLGYPGLDQAARALCGSME